MKKIRFKVVVFKVISRIRCHWADHYKRYATILISMLLLFTELFTSLAPLQRCVGFWVANMPEFELSAIVGKRGAERFQNLDDVMKSYIQPNTIYDTNGEVIARMDSPDNIPYFLQNYLVILENNRFYDTYVVDWTGVIRAMITDIVHGDFVQGASGIIQQFSRGIILQNDRKFWLRKMKEVLISYGLSYKYSHQKLLHYYMSSVFLGSFNSPPIQIRGLKRGADELFGQDITKITKPQGLALITLISSPNTYLKNKTAFQIRYNHLAYSLRNRKIISEDEYQRIINNIPIIDTTKVKLRAAKIAYRKQIVDQLNSLDNNSPLIQTTIDLNVVESAHKTLTKAVGDFTKETGIRDLDGFMIVARNDSLLAIIGSAQTGDGYMNNSDIRSAWRPGSLVKPLIYSEFISEGGNIYQKLPAGGPKTFKVSDGIWTVKNYSNRDNDPHDQKAINALARSNNVAAAYLAVNYGDSLQKRLHKAGADSTFSHHPATFIGADAPKPLDLFRLLQTYVPPYGKIPDHFIEIKNDTSHYVTLFDTGVARETAYCLENALRDSRGTLHFTEGLYNWNDTEFLGKTGTAQQSTSAGLFVVRPGGVSVLMGVFSRSGKSLRYLNGGAIQGASLAPYMQHFFKTASINGRINGRFDFRRDEFHAKKDHIVKKLKSWFDKIKAIF
ncbi:MAG TPA: transglycosylase domain-containing protein [Balneolales bacterium]|nr:transglycosylase domain-containing protein [Balneolales bacterium]